MTETELQAERDRCLKIAAIEAHYWGELDDARMIKFALGAMGAASNICAAILRELTPEQHRAECDARGSNVGEFGAQEEKAR